jgi:Helix-turn-helix
MASLERKYDRAQSRAAKVTAAICAELRDARLSAGRSQRDIASGVRISPSQLARIELGHNRSVPLSTLVLLGSMLGLDVVVKAYPGGRVLRDGPQLRLLSRFCDRVGGEWGWRREVLVAHGDQRAWDAYARHARTGAEFVVEAETRIHDVQALLRRIALKREASGNVRVVLLVAGTHNNREAIALAPDAFHAEFPGSMRSCMRALAEGRAPAQDTLIILGPAQSAASRPAGNEANDHS